MICKYLSPPKIDTVVPEEISKIAELFLGLTWDFCCLNTAAATILNHQLHLHCKIQLHNSVRMCGLDPNAANDRTFPVKVFMKKDNNPIHGEGAELGFTGHRRQELRRVTAVLSQE